MVYRLIKLDIVDDEINDMRDTGLEGEFAAAPTLEAVCGFLKAHGRMAMTWPLTKVSLDDDDGSGDYYICDEDGKKVYKLEPRI